MTDLAQLCKDREALNVVLLDQLTPEYRAIFTALLAEIESEIQGIEGLRLN